MFGWFKRKDPLTRTALEQLRAAAPSDARVRALDRDTLELRDAAGTRVMCSLDSLRQDIESSPEEAESRIAQHVAAWVAMLEPLPLQVDPQRLLPMLKPAGWARAVTPVADEQPLCAPCPADTEVLVVEEVGGRLRFVSARVARDSGMDQAQLLALAQERLDQLVADMEILPGVEGGPFTAALPGRYSFNASVVLSPLFWAKAGEAVGGEVRVAIPERELCVFSPAADAAMIEELAEVARLVHAQAAYPVCAVLLDAGSWLELGRTEP